MAAITIFTLPASEVPEGSSHEYGCTFEDASGAALQVGAIQDIRGWLDWLTADGATGGTINNRANAPLLNAGGGTVVDSGGGVALFTWALDGADAPIAGAVSGQARETHRITLRVTYAKSGGGTGTLTHEVRYPVVSFDRIS